MSSSTASEELSQPCTQACNTSQPPLKRFKLLAQDANAQLAMASASTTVTASNTVDTELMGYLSDSKTYDGNSGLVFWINSEHRYPLLAPIAQDLLAAPASEAYVERVFSVCGDLTSGKRNRLDKRLEKRAFLKMNSKYYK